MDDYKRLTRSLSNRRIAGVCGGLAKYLNIDPTAARVVFAVSILFGFIGVWAYLIMWLIVPEEGGLQQ